MHFRRATVSAIESDQSSDDGLFLIDHLPRRVVAFVNGFMKLIPPRRHEVVYGFVRIKFK
jgi:hypothetical protein